MIPKCKNCEMPKRIKKQNISIQNNSGACSMCYQAQERVKDAKKSR